MHVVEKRCAGRVYTLVAKRSHDRGEEVEPYFSEKQGMHEQGNYKIKCTFESLICVKQKSLN